MPPKSRTPTKTVRVKTAICPGCNHLLITVETEGGKTLILDTQHGTTWVLSGRETRAGVPIAVPSRGYVVHKEPCHGASFVA